MNQPGHRRAATSLWTAAASLKIPHYNAMGVTLHCIYMYMSTSKSQSSQPLCVASLSRHLHQTVWSESNVSEYNQGLNHLHHHHRLERKRRREKWTRRVSCMGPLRCTEILNPYRFFKILHVEFFAVKMQATLTQSTTFHYWFHFQPLINAGSDL